jgi:lysophospholipase L1-like esterase
MKLPVNDTSFDDNEELQAFTRERDYEEYTRESKPKPNPIVNSVVSSIAYVQFFWIHHRAEFILGLILLGAVTLALTGTIEAYELGKHRSQKRTHTIKHDYSEIKSSLELKLGQIDHWCLAGGDNDCPRCDDPTKATHRMDNRGWGRAHQMNIKDAKNIVEGNGEIDVVFLGDNNIEAVAGRFYGGNGVLPKADEKKMKDFWGGPEIEELLRRSKNKFDKKFDTSAGGAYNGLALGISGDTSPNLLWRIQHDEMLTLKPKVWWVSIGVNDLLATSCSEEITLMGILRVVEELVLRKDGATVVINSLLPIATRSDLKLEGKHVRNKYWPSIKLINARLQTFAKKHPGVKFFDPNDVLTEHRGKSLYMKREMFTDKFHLSAEGQGALAEQQASVVAAIYKKREEKANGDSSYRDASGGDSTSTSDGEAAQTKFEEAEEKFMENEDDLYGYPSNEITDDFFQFDWNGNNNNPWNPPK